MPTSFSRSPQPYVPSRFRSLRFSRSLSISLLFVFLPQSVLCIKCKKSLDDLSNIRSAVLGLGSEGGGGAQKMQCEHYRILLPNFRGKKPNRSVGWLRNVMRAILLAKMREVRTV